MGQESGTNLKYKDFFAELEELQKIQRCRSLRNIQDKNEKFLTVNGRKYLNLSSNDYLGLANNIELTSKLVNLLNTKSVIEKYGLASSSSRLLTGNYSLYDELESEIAKFYNRESSLVFNSGYHANIGVISGLLKKGDVIFSDKLNHASIIDGMKLSGAEFFRYNHLDYGGLERLVQKNRNKYKKAIIISESIFSMDGDRADLRKLVELKNKYNTLLMIDEAHAVGVFGKTGCGVCEEDNLIQEIDIIVGTFGKALASIGAYVVADSVIRDYLINKSRSLIFTTALPPINVFWTHQIIKFLPELYEKRMHLKQLADLLRNSLQEYGISTKGESQIVPVILGEDELAVKMANKLQEAGFWLLPVRPPAVPEGSSRIRISLTSALQWNNIRNISTIIAGEIN